jgi:hypothetical protein
MSFLTAAARFRGIIGADAVLTDDALRQLAFTVQTRGEPAPSKAPGETAGATARRDTKGKNIEAKMLKVLSEDYEARGWTAVKWGKHLKCSDGTIKGTKVWKVHLKADRAWQKLRRQRPLTSIVAGDGRQRSRILNVFFAVICR